MKSVRSRLLIMLVLAAIAVPGLWASAHARACERGSSSIRSAATWTTVTRSGVRPSGTSGEPDVPQKMPPVIGHSSDAPPVEGPSDDMSGLSLLRWVGRIWMARYLGMR
jgi:hypothetical protein